MVEEQVRRRRRRRRRGGAGAVGAPEAKSSAPAAPDWQWRTFPVFLALMVGLLVGAIATGIPGLSVAVLLIALTGVAFGVAHIFTRAVVARRRRRRE